MTRAAFSKANEVTAAWSTVEPLLASKGRGEQITYSEVKLAGGGIDPRRLGSKIRRYFLKHGGIDLEPIPNVGWLIPTDEHSVKARGEFRRNRAKRETKTMLLGVGSVDESKLTPDTRRLRDLYVRHGALAITAAKDTDAERKAILGAPPARPQLPTKG